MQPSRQPWANLRRKEKGRVANSDAGRRRASAIPLSRFVRDGKSEAVGQELVLLADGPRAGKPEALAQHSMASKPWIVRRAVLNERKPPTRGIARLTRKWSLSMPCCRRLVT